MNEPFGGRRSLRLAAFDYASNGAYFVTICTRQRACLFGEIVDETMHVNEAGSAVEDVWSRLPGHYADLQLDAFVVMPDHVHGILVLSGATGERQHGLPEIIRAMKSFSARRINELRGTQGTVRWQRGYYDRIIRNERELAELREYIASNPQRWAVARTRP